MIANHLVLIKCISVIEVLVFKQLILPRFEVAVEKVADCDELRGLIYSDETCR